MPRTISSALLTSIQSGFGKFSLLVLLTRKDGLKLGFTTSDTAVVFGGVTYEPNDGGQITSMHSSAGTGIDNADFSGILTSSRLIESEIITGKWDLATVVISIVDRANIADGQVIVGTGYIGQIETSSGAFKAEYRSLGQMLRQSAGDLTSFQCRVRKLGDSQCKVNLSGNTADGYPIQVNANVSSVTDNETLSFGSVTTPTGYYNYGLITFTSGVNNGFVGEVKSHTNVSSVAELTLRQPMPFLPSIGDSAMLQIGCDRLPATCLNRFNNVINYHGEKDLPSNAQVSIVGRPPVAQLPTNYG